MKTLLLIGMVGTAWMLLRKNNRAAQVVPAEEAAAKLREAWADYHAA